ncbi:MAG: SMP-30/gluconolactonase/LRE family protein [Rhizobiaceae bacterium]
MTITPVEIRKLTAEPCELGEGPGYDPHTDTAWWLDILGCKLLEHQFASGTTTIHGLPRMGSVIARIDNHRQLLAMEDGLYIRQIEDGQLKQIAELEADNTITRSNDGRVHPSGRLWIGTMGREAEENAGSIYWFDGTEVKRLFRDITIPNSICFTPDGRTGYFADTKKNIVWRVPLDPQNGMPTGEPEEFLTARDLPLGGGFDGSIIDADGLLWNATWGSGSINGFAPDASLVRTYKVPAARPSCPAFVGSRLDKMLVTTAFEGYTQADRLKNPEAGNTFILDGNFNGIAEPVFRLPS